MFFSRRNKFSGVTGWFRSAGALAVLTASGAALLSSDADAACPASFSDYQVAIFSGTSGLMASPELTVYPTSSSSASNYKVLGGGAIVHTIAGSAFLTASYPDVDPGSSVPLGWTAAAKNLGTGVQARISVYAIAVNDPDNCWDVKLFQSSTSTAVAHPATSVSVAPGYVLAGGGARAEPVTPGRNGNFLFSSIPAAVGGSVYNGWSVHSKDHGVTDIANITAYAVGIKAVGAGVATPVLNVIAGKPSAAADYPAASANGYSNVLVGLTCTLTGGGAHDDWNNGYGNLLTAIYPAGTTNWQSFAGFYGQSNPAVLTAYAVCLQ